MTPIQNGTDIDESIRDLKSPYNNRNRYENPVLGAIELAFRRGYQAGYEDSIARRRGKKA